MATELNFDWFRCLRISAFYLLLMTWTPFVVAQEWRWVTVLAVSKDNGASNVYNMLMTTGVLNDGTGKELLPVQSIVSTANFKSALADQWSAYSPLKARLTLYNRRGLLWYTEFNNTSGGKDPGKWLKRSTLTFATDGEISDDPNAQFTFTSTKLTMTADSGGNERLQMTWDPKPQFLVATKFWPPIPPPLAVPPAESIDSMIAAKLETATSFGYSWGTSYAMFFNSNQYFIGIAINKTGSGHIQKFQLSYSSDKDCKTKWSSGADFQYYTNSSGQPAEFVPTFNQGSTGTLGVMPLDEVVGGSCLKLTVLERVEPPNCTIFLYTTNSKVLEAPIFAIQWWIDIAVTPSPVTTTEAVASDLTCTTMTVCSTTQIHGVTTPSADVMADNQTLLEQAVLEIKAKLYLPKEETSRFKRQYYCMPDNRYSAILIGIVGVGSISAVILGVVILDFATIFLHLKQMRSNIRSFVCKNSVRQS